MNVLEKILEEIEERFEDLRKADDACRIYAESDRNFEGMKYFQNLMFATDRAKSIVEEIIHSHMDEMAEKKPRKEAVKAFRHKAYKNDVKLEK